MKSSMLQTDQKEEKMECQKYTGHFEEKRESVLENIKDKRTLIEKELDELPVARIDYLSSGGQVFCSLDFAAESAFLKTLKEELHYGVPLVVVLYRDRNGKTISQKFLEDLDTLPKGLKEEEHPLLRSKKVHPWSGKAELKSLSQNRDNKRFDL